MSILEMHDGECNSSVVKVKCIMASVACKSQKLETSLVLGAAAGRRAAAFSLSQVEVFRVLSVRGLVGLYDSRIQTEKHITHKYTHTHTPSVSVCLLGAF